MVMIFPGRQQWGIAHVTPLPHCERLGISSSSRPADPEGGEAERGYGFSKGDMNEVSVPLSRAESVHTPVPTAFSDKVPYLQAATCVYTLWKKKDRGQSSKPGSWVSGVRMLVQHGDKSGRCV